MSEDCIETSTVEKEHEGVALRYIDATRHLSVHTNTAEIIKHNKDLEYKLLNVQEEYRRITTADVITKDRKELT